MDPQTHPRIPPTATQQPESRLPAADQLLTIDEVARELGVTVRTLRRWHTLRMGPPRCKLRHYVRFRAGDLAQWIRDQREDFAAA